MADKLTEQWEKFTLLEEESVGVDIPEHEIEMVVSQGSLSIVGKLLSNLVVGKDIVRIPMVWAWHLSGWVKFKDLGPNLFLIEFEHSWDKSRILEGCPWTFDGHLLSLVDFDGMTPPHLLEFEKVAFWVRIFKLPLGCMGKATRYRIGSTVGEVKEVDVNEDGIGWGEFLRVRIVLDLTKDF
ncbi:uncharacterized protein LOC132187908 [Corylus avellana]|uniref:uncharacterized protein LOC132187908 n=1 Tax=Corylus avellana TaxID=13451 RepID=UPI00286A1482|nr:uncharacterized protein LOC132187908 [Corylus avellana]